MLTTKGTTTTSPCTIARRILISWLFQMWLVRAFHPSRCVLSSTIRTPFVSTTNAVSAVVARHHKSAVITASFASIAPEQPGIETTTRELSSQHPVDDTAEKVPAKFVPHPFSYRQELNIQIDALTNRGMGIGRVVLTEDQIKAMEEYKEASANAPKSRRRRRKADKNGDDEHDDAIRRFQNNSKDENNTEQQDETSARQWVIMVPSVLPGETVKARVFRNKKRYSEADLVTVVEASEDRVDPICPLAGDCGGCQLQHMSIEAQRRMKTQQVQEYLNQYETIQNVPVQPCLGTDDIYGYRSKLTPHYQQPEKSRRGAKNVDSHSVKQIRAIGFQKQSSRQLVDVEQCPIGTPEINHAYAKLRAKLRSEPPETKRGATLLLRQANLGDAHIETNHANLLTTSVRGLNFTYQAGNFFQNNYYVLPLMVDHVVEEATRGGQMTHLADCYCGSGLFALSAAAQFDTVVGIEINEKAIAEATANAQKNDIGNCSFQAASAENIFSVISDFPRDTTAVVLDPPRKGCSEDFLQQLLDFSPRRIVYMSCDPTTQARDAAMLTQKGAYRITNVQPFDLFPQTRHIECLMILERNESS